METVTLSKVLWTGTQVPSCQHTNFQVFGTPLTPTEGNTATTARLRTPNKVCRHRVRDVINKDAWNEPIIENNLGIPTSVTFKCQTVVAVVQKIKGSMKVCDRGTCGRISPQLDSHLRAWCFSLKIYPVRLLTLLRASELWCSWCLSRLRQEALPSMCRWSCWSHLCFNCERNCAVATVVYPSSAVTRFCLLLRCASVSYWRQSGDGVV